MAEKEKELRPKSKSEDEDLTHSRFSTLVDLFEAIDINEKGIEIVYDYLLTHEMIDDPKTVFEALGLSLKRVYKILGVLKDMGLIYVYDRPMKIYRTEVMRGWQSFLSQVEANWKQKLDEKVTGAEQSLKRMLLAYNVPEQLTVPPVEFIPYEVEENFIELLLMSLTIQKHCFITKEMRFGTVSQKFFNALINQGKSKFPNTEDLFKKIEKAFSNISIHILINADLVEEVWSNLFQLPKYEKFFTPIDKMTFNITLKVTDQPVGNLIIKDDKELLQPSVAPNNTLLGWFLSRQKEVIDVFTNKFETIFESAVPINEYMQKMHQKPINQLEMLYFVVL